MGLLNFFATTLLIIAHAHFSHGSFLSKKWWVEGILIIISCIMFFIAANIHKKN